MSEPSVKTRSSTLRDLVFRRRWIRIALSLGFTLAPMTVVKPAFALQGLGEFIEASKTANYDGLEASAVARQRVLEAEQAWAKLYPSFTARGAYTLNQFEAISKIPGSATEPPRDVIITPRHQFEATFVIDIPLIDVGAWKRASAADATAEVAKLKSTTTLLDVNKQVSRQYYQLLASRAVLSSAEKAVEAALASEKVAKDRKTAGVASELDLDRASAAIASARRTVADAEQLCALAKRALETLTGLAPTAGYPAMSDDLHDEAPLDSFRGSGLITALPTVRLAALDIFAAKKTIDAAYATLYPTLSASATERLTNATGFANKSSIYSLGLTLTWRFDVQALPAIKVAEASRELAEIRARRAEVTAKDEIHDAWIQVTTQIAKSKAARVQEAADVRAAKMARDRYAEGKSTQLEVITADRDAFASSVARIQADADLAYARILLRISAGRSVGTAEAVKETPKEPLKEPIKEDPKPVPTGTKVGP